MLPWLSAQGIILAATLSSRLVVAAPGVAFPFNSQVPEVARKNQQYSFQLSDSTFSPQDADLVYSISAQPAWLTLDGTTRTLRGMPGDADVGSSVFMITAADKTGAAHMQCTLVVASEPAPKLQGDFTQQLAAEINLTSTTPATLTLTPGMKFDLHFRSDSFIDIVQRKLYYYATLTDHTPLPSWLLFDSSSLSFSGLAPSLSAFPQRFDVSLIASDYAGFAGASATFSVVIATQQLTIVPSQQTVRFSPGSALAFSLKDAVYINGQKVSSSDLQSATADVPSWVKFDGTTLTLTGTAPQDAQAQDGSVTVQDKQNNQARVALHFVSDGASLFAGTLGTVTLTPGQTFSVAIPTSVVNEADVVLDVIEPSDAGWMSIDSQARLIQGTVPQSLSPTVFTATLEAKAPSVTSVQVQTFAVDIASALSSMTSATGSSLSTSTPSGSSILADYSSDSSSHLQPGIIAAIVICSIVGTVILLLLLLFCCRVRRRREGGYVDRTPSPMKRIISGPILEKAPDSILVTTLVHHDVEKEAALERKDSLDADRPPQIALEIPAGTTKLAKWDNRGSGVSQVSSIGNGEETIIQDSNIPEWGRDTSALHRPHDSFSIPVEMAKGRKHERSISPAKRMFQRLTGDSRQSKQSVGLGIDTGDGVAPLKPLQPRRSKNLRHKASDRSSCASFSTQATSLLSTRPSDFPRPPTQSTMAGSRPSLPGDKRRSIRFIRRTDSVDDSRPIDKKRESFIRNRASASVISPLFSHGSRQPADVRATSRTLSSDMDSSMPNRGRSSRLTGTASKSSYSQSSSADREERRLSHRIRSAFAPNFPRVVSRPDLDVYETEREVVDDDLDENWEDVTPAGSRHNSEADVRKLAREMAKPRHLRSWVLPGEASPTPPPLQPLPQVTPRKVSSHRGASIGESELRQRWRERVTRSDRLSSPLTHVVQSIEGEDGGKRAPKVPSKSPHRRYSHVNEPLGLVAKDSLSRSKGNEKLRLSQTKMSRPVSVAGYDRLSSLKAEHEEDTRAGCEDVQGAGLGGPEGKSDARIGTERSHASGKIFL